MKVVPAIIDALKASLAEQASVEIYVAGAHFGGIVSKLDDHIVEVRHAHGSTRVIIVLDQVIAVSMD